MTADRHLTLVPDQAPDEVAAQLLARIRSRPPRSDFQRRHDRRRNVAACRAACAAADGPPARRQPMRLDPDQRLAQIVHARANAFLTWEISALVPAPVTDQERAALA